MHTTRTVSMKVFRENMTKFFKEARDKNVHFVVMRHSEPIAHITPLSRKDSLESLMDDIAQARKEVKEGKTVSLQQARKLLGV